MKYKLEKKFALKWMNALRSGDYKQGCSFLKSDGMYCCLGVACVITMPNAKLDNVGFIEKEPGGTNPAISARLYNKMPKLLRGSSGFVNKVSTMNDTGKTFNDIADWIEKNVEFI